MTAQTLKHFESVPVGRSLFSSFGPFMVYFSAFDVVVGVFTRQLFGLLLCLFFWSSFAPRFLRFFWPFLLMCWWPCWAPAAGGLVGSAAFILKVDTTTAYDFTFVLRSCPVLFINSFAFHFLFGLLILCAGGPVGRLPPATW